MHIRHCAGTVPWRGHGYRGLLDIPQQKIGEGIATEVGRILRRIGLESVLAARVLIADLVEILTIKFKAEFEAVLTMVP